MIALEAQIPLLREAGKRLAKVLREVGEAAKPGVSTADLDALAERLIREGGDTPSLIGYTPKGAKRPYPATICISINDEVVHGIPNEKPRIIADGDIVSLDCVLTHEGVFVDAAISVIAGNGDEDARDLLQATKEALAAGIAAARGGNHIGDISAAVEAVGVRRGYGIVFELGGHGVGNSVHEEPWIPNVGDAGEGEELVPGMVLAIEPMFTEGTPKVKLMPDGYTFVTKDGSRAAHFEHTILITDGAPEVLTDK
ncbi:MAG: type I methionyl aminopeptidase [Patescibacteria group bacterium]|nr:type I methionyl aminopeptidase [Patescibacteria group bacterium]